MFNSKPLWTARNGQLFLGVLGVRPYICPIFACRPFTFHSKDFGIRELQKSLNPPPPYRLSVPYLKIRGPFKVIVLSPALSSFTIPISALTSRKLTAKVT